MSETAHRTCRRCSRELPLTNFYVDRRRGIPYARCKTCHNRQSVAADQRRRSDPTQGDAMRAKARQRNAAERRERPHLVRSRKRRSYRRNSVAILDRMRAARNTPEGRKRYREYYNRSPERRAAALAHAMVHRAVKRGVLTRPDHCARCGVETKPEAHHPRGYAPEHWLDVDWLCVDCHVAAHH